VAWGIVPGANLKFEILNLKDMNKLDKQFEEMMKGVRIDSPSSDFMLKVMSRIQAEAAVTKRSVLQDYQPVISKRTWIVLIGIFVLLMVYLILSGKETATNSGIWSTISGSLNQLKENNGASILQKGMDLFSSVPSIAYLILTASLVLWTLDSVLNRFKHQPSDIRIS
jgi:hypothetical protein